MLAWSRTIDGRLGIYRVALGRAACRAVHLRVAYMGILGYCGYRLYASAYSVVRTCMHTDAMAARGMYMMSPDVVYMHRAAVVAGLKSPYPSVLID